MEPRPMAKKRYTRHSLRGPVTLFVVVLVLSLTLAVLWHVILVHEYHKLRDLAHTEAFHWSFIALGTVLFMVILLLSSILGTQLIGHIRWNQRQSNFIASVSHELNSPLSSIKLFAQTLRQPEMSVEDRLNFVGKILFDVERLQRLIGNILRAAEVDNEGEVLPVVPRRLEVIDYLTSYVDDARALCRNTGLSITLEATERAWVQLDAMMFRQVLDNLIDNAIHYRSAAAPRVRIQVFHDEGSVYLDVSDNGIGIPTGELGSVFERFYQVKSDRQQGRRGRRGTGIGLFIVRSIVEAHGGRVEARSAGRERGTTISIRLPPSPLPLTSPSGTLTAATPEAVDEGRALEPHSAG